MLDQSTSGVTLFFIILGLVLTEGALILIVYAQNKRLKISKIDEDADAIVEKMSDDDLRNKLRDELKS